MNLVKYTNSCTQENSNGYNVNATL